MRFIAVIPARYASTRFPGKPLARLGDKTVIERVVAQVSAVVDDVYVATDDSRIYDAVAAFGGRAVMTSASHRSGTDRVEEAVERVEAETGIRFDVVINVQGDEPFIHRSQIETVKRCFDDPRTEIATLAKPFHSPELSPEEELRRIENVNSPKVAVSREGFALYFSRSVIPFIRGRERAEWPGAYPFLKHIGLYAYRREVLREVTRLEQSPLELAESLEQLRWLENGYRIRVGLTDIETIGIDTPADLAAATAWLNEKH